jgi:type II secretory pathway pseudopilin PulG
MVRILQTLRRRLQGEGGFTIVEAMISITILAVGAFAVAQASIFGLSSTGLSRQKLSSRAAVDQQMEEARALNYDNLVLSDSTAIPHSTDPNNPDHWVDQSAQTFDPDGNGPLAPEDIVRVAGASPALAHYQNPLVDGATTYEVYRYVTWYDAPQDGTGSGDAADGNGDGVDDSSGHDAKRVTVVVVWNDELGRGSTTLSESSLFSNGEILYKQPATNAAPSVGCPTASVADKTVTFTANASDSDGSIASVTWNFGDGSPTVSGTTVTHTYANYLTYTVVNTVTDNDGSTASNSAAGCTVTTLNPGSGNGGPDGTIQINGNAAYTNSTTVTLTLAKSAGPNPSTMTFSNDNSTWLGPYSWATSYVWTLSPGDGTKTVYMRLYDASNKYGAIATDTIVLDTTAPSTPTNFAKSSTTVVGQNTTITFTWSAVTDAALGGYRVYSRLITSTGSYSLVCDTSSTTCSDTHKKTDTYEYYIVAYDLATNVSAGSTPHLTG